MLEFVADSGVVDSVQSCELCRKRFERVEERVSKEFELISKLNSVQPFDGPWFLVSTKWIKRWELFMRHSYDTDESPGPVDNSTLFDGNHLRQRLVKSKHYRGVNWHAWNALLLLYGGCSDQEEP